MLRIDQAGEPRHQEANKGQVEASESRIQELSVVGMYGRV